MLRHLLPRVVGFALLALAAPGWLRAETDAPAGAGPAGDDPALRPLVVVVKPVILRDDDGANPARHALPKTYLDQAYTRAGLEVILLEPVTWDHGPARRGEINLDEIEKQGRANGMVAGDPRVVTLLFVSAVDGKPGPLGRGRQGGNVCFVALGPDGQMTDPAARAFVVGHELGHCLNLAHATDDPEVPDDAPNLMGEGEFKDRVAAAALQPSQAATIRKSRLALPRVHCYRAAEARELLEDESWFPFHTTATADAVRFALGLAPNAPVPADPAERARVSREGHAAMALDFTAAEQAALERSIAALRRELGGDWPLLDRLPWHFVKVKSGFCGDLPHTRGLATVLSENALQQLLEEPEMARFVLFHEKIHVVQRLSPGRFAGLFKAYGYHPARLAAGEAARLNLVVNPDAPVHDQAIAVDGRKVLIAPAFTRNGNRLGFAENYFLLKPGNGGEFLIDGEFPAAPVEQWLERFPIRAGYDHPHEAFAYLCNILLDLRQRKALAKADDNPMLRATLDALPEIFRLEGE